MHDLTSGRHFKAFFGAGVCFYFRHFTLVYNYTLEAFPTGGPLSNLFRKYVLLKNFPQPHTIGIWERKDKVELPPGKAIFIEKAGSVNSLPDISSYKYTNI